MCQPDEGNVASPFSLSYLPQQSALLSIRRTILPAPYCALSFLLGLNWAILSFCVPGVDAEEGSEYDHVCGFSPTVPIGTVQYHGHQQDKRCALCGRLQSYRLHSYLLQRRQ